MNAQRLFDESVDVDAFSITEVVDRIININSGMQEFWSSAKGWAPLRAAQLLNKSRLDWQVQLSKTLKLFLDTDELHDGYLILGWTNLGSLIEGALKTFLSVHYEDYFRDINVIRKESDIIEPDGCMLEPLKEFFRKSIWGDGELDEIVTNIQRRRNAIHAFQDRKIGDFEELHAYIRKFLKTLRYINFRLPYPDDVFIPQEQEGKSVIVDFTEKLKKESETITEE